MKLELVEVTSKDRNILGNLLQLCLHDYTEFESFEIGPEGKYDSRWFAAYFQESNRHAYLLKIDGNIGGFVLVRQSVDGEDWDNQIAEFFVLRKYRRSGIGTEAAKTVLKLFPGMWEISYYDNNSTAAVFWNAFARNYLSAEFEGNFENEGRSRYRIKMPKQA